jgi:hypothetical protein
MASANPTIKLAVIRSQIDRQQQVISKLESELQQAILGGTGGVNSANQIFEETFEGILTQIDDIYGNDGVPYDGDDPAGEGKYQNELTRAIYRGISSDWSMTDDVEQDGLRQLLYQARALLGELRVEEQHWNGEVNEEKGRRKDLADMTKA